MITIDQLLESVDLDFEPRWVTNDMVGHVRVWEKEPTRTRVHWTCGGTSKFTVYEHLKLAEFEGKDWTECIYQVPRKQDFFQNGKIERFIPADFATVRDINEYVRSVLDSRALDRLNMLVDAVNELKGAKNENKM